MRACLVEEIVITLRYVSVAHPDVSNKIEQKGGYVNVKRLQYHEPAVGPGKFL